jgi:transcriptional regulator with XRE-family HTH domain
VGETGHLQNLALNICNLRKQSGLTQEALADRLGLTFQAVSKWENFQSSPDIQLLPRLAEIFQVSVDRLFGLEKQEPAEKERSLQAVGSAMAEGITAKMSPQELPWPDDGNLRVVLYKGRTLLQSDDAEEPKMVFRYEGAALNVESRISVECGDVEGHVHAGRDIRCGEVGGGANAGRDVLCFDVQGDAGAGRDVQCSDVDGSVTAGQDVRCGNVSGDAGAGRNITCSEVGGSVSAMGHVECANVGGSITTLGPVSYTGPGGEKPDKNGKAVEAAGTGGVGKEAEGAAEGTEGAGGVTEGAGKVTEGAAEVIEGPGGVSRKAAGAVLE